MKLLFSHKYIMPYEKIASYLLHPGSRHAEEFFDVGYTKLDVVKLNTDIDEQFDIENAVEYRNYEDNISDFNIYMMLGIKKKRRFRTVWRLDSPDSKPRFITAYRKDE